MLPLLASVDSLDFRIAQSIAVGVSFFFFANSACSPQQAQRAIADALDFFTAVFKLDLDGSRFTFAEYSRDSTVEYARGHGITDLVASFEVRTMSFLHSHAPRLILTGRGF